MPSDPYAKYLTPPEGAAPAAGADDPYAKYLNAPGANVAKAGSDLDYSQSPWSALGRTFESSADWGTGDLLRAAMTGKSRSETAAQSSAAAASLPWYVRWPTEAAGYGLGLVNLLDPVTDAAEAGVASLGAGSTLAKMAGTAAEGGIVGGVSHVATTDDPTVLGTAGAAAGGAALGGAAGAAAPLVNKGLTKAFGKAGTIDPDAAIAATQANKTAKYNATESPQAPQFSPQSFTDAYTKPVGDLTRLQNKDVSKPFMDLMQDHVNDAYKQGTVSPGDVNYYVQRLEDAASNGAETALAGKIRSNLLGENGFLKTAQPVSDHPVGQAYDMLQQANEANKQFEMAQNLKDYQQTVQGGGSLGGRPLTEAMNYYQNDPQSYAVLQGLANQGGTDHGIGWMLPHLAAHTLGIGGYELAGIPGSIVGELLGLAMRKPINQALSRRARAGQVRNIQAAYPQLTGQQPTGATTGPQLPQGSGDVIKNLILGGVY